MQFDKSLLEVVSREKQEGSMGEEKTALIKKRFKNLSVNRNREMGPTLYGGGGGVLFYFF